MSPTFVPNKKKADRKFVRKNKLCHYGLFSTNRQTYGAIVVLAGCETNDRAIFLSTSFCNLISEIQNIT